MSQKRNWTVNNCQEIEQRIEDMLSTISIFKKSIENANERNKISFKKISELESEAFVLKEKFIDLNGISYEDAIVHVESSKNPDSEFNLEQFNLIKSIEDSISGERFFVYQREKLISKNQKIIVDISERILELEKKKKAL
ncbi:MAG: hypothetical protein HUJ42_00245 [Malacoplasma sp.]|nr:hypothetical protein [Malacoplasma sp.]